MDARLAVESFVDNLTPLRVILLSIFSIVSITLALALRRCQRNPEKTFLYCLVCECLTPLRMFRIYPFSDGELTLDKCLQVAIKKAKCSDFGDPTMQFVENYKCILNSEEHRQQSFTNLGYISARIEVVMTFARRLKFVEYMKANPQVEKVPVTSPVFVTGLPRTGTTLLHRLLALDTKRVRAPLLWELLHPVPRVKLSNDEKSKEALKADRESRAAWVRKLVESRRRLGDRALQHIHEVDADLPEECIMGLNDEIPVGLCFLYSGYMNTDAYGGKIKISPAYHWYRKQLQLLSAQIGETENPRNWMLKCPFHMNFVKEIAEAFPDAKIIWTHRHPVSAVPSLCSLLKAVHQIYYESDGRDDEKLGSRVEDISGKNVHKCMKELKETGLECIHSKYEDLVKDPIACIKGIYKQFGWEFTSEYEMAMKQYLQEDKINREKVKMRRGKSDLHTYSPEEFGLTEKQLSSGHWESYIKMFNLPLSRN